VIFEAVPVGFVFAIPVKPPATVLRTSCLLQVANELTLPLMSTVQSPAGIMMPALATEADAKTAPATAKLIKLN